MTPEPDPLELAHKRPQWSAVNPLTWPQKILLVLAVAAVAVAAWLAPFTTARYAIAFCTAVYVALMLYKFLILRGASTPKAILRFSPDEIRAQEPRTWPVYSILVPMYNEPETLPQILNGVSFVF